MDSSPSSVLLWPTAKVVFFFLKFLYFAGITFFIYTVICCQTLMLQALKLSPRKQTCNRNLLLSCFAVTEEFNKPEENHWWQQRRRGQGLAVEVVQSLSGISGVRDVVLDNCSTRADTSFQEKMVVSQVCRTLARSPPSFCFKNCSKFQSGIAVASRRAGMHKVVFQRPYFFSCFSSVCCQEQ